MNAPRPNRFPASCCICNTRFEAQEGWMLTHEVGGRLFYCAKHKPGADTLARTRIVWDPDNTDATAPAATPVGVDDLVARIVQLSTDFATREVPRLVAEQIAALAPRELEVKIGSAAKVRIDVHHKSLPTVLTAISAGCHPFLVGPAGSGKTTLAEQVAKALKRKFYMAARVTSEYKLVGFVDAQGRTVRTQFREAYEHGGVFLFDEVDASDPDALTAFNAALANGYGDFPDGMVARHKDFVAIAAGNTYGRGADRQYVGRNQLDAATLDRFQVFDIDYDEVLESTLAGDVKWTTYVQKVRRAVETEKVRHIVSPRASIMGARMLAAGMEWKEVEAATIWKGLPAETRQRVEYRMTAGG